MGGSRSIFARPKPEVALPALPLLRKQTEMRTLRRLQQIKRFPTFPTVITLYKPWEINCSRFVFGKVSFPYFFHFNAVGLR